MDVPRKLGDLLAASFDYVAYPVRGRARLVARGLVEKFLEVLGEPAFVESQVLGRWKGADLEGLTYQHPLFERVSPLILGDHVTLEAGTGCVHTAPGHGADDFETGRKYGLGILSPVDEAGVFKAEAGGYAGKKVFDANARLSPICRLTGRC